MAAAKCFFVAILSALAVAEQLLPAKTIAADHINYLGWTPKPTDGPLLAGHHLGLRKRQNVPNSVCGYLADDIDNEANAISCASGYCGFFPSLSAFGCCDQTTISNGQTYLTECEPYTECNDSTVGCDAACQTNSNLNACLQSTRPYCVKYTLFASAAGDELSSYSYYGCAASSGLDPITLLSVDGGALTGSASASATSSQSASASSSSTSASASSSSEDVSPASFSSSLSSSSSSSDEEPTTTAPNPTPAQGGAGLNTGSLQPYTSSSRTVAAPSSSSSTAAAGANGNSGQYSLIAVVFSWALGFLV